VSAGSHYVMESMTTISVKRAFCYVNPCLWWSTFKYFVVASIPRCEPYYYMLLTVNSDFLFFYYCWWLRIWEQEWFRIEKNFTK